MPVAFLFSSTTTGTERLCTNESQWSYKAVQGWAQTGQVDAKAGRVSMEMATQEGQKKKQLWPETGKMTFLFGRCFFQPWNLHRS